MEFVIKVVVSAAVISFSSWLAGRSPTAAGFLVAMPVATLLVLPMAQLEHGQTENTIALAKSILVAIPVTLGFFLPFVLADRFGWSFWTAYLSGCALLPIGYFIHRGVASLWTGSS